MVKGIGCMWYKHTYRTEQGPRLACSRGPLQSSKSGFCTQPAKRSKWALQWIDSSVSCHTELQLACQNKAAPRGFLYLHSLLPPLHTFYLSSSIPFVFIRSSDPALHSVLFPCIWPPLLFSASSSALLFFLFSFINCHPSFPSTLPCTHYRPGGNTSVLMEMEVKGGIGKRRELKVTEAEKRKKNNKKKRGQDGSHSWSLVHHWNSAQQWRLVGFVSALLLWMSSYRQPQKGVLIRETQYVHSCDLMVQECNCLFLVLQLFNSCEEGLSYN